MNLTTYWLYMAIILDFSVRCNSPTRLLWFLNVDYGTHLIATSYYSLVIALYTLAYPPDPNRDWIWYYLRRIPGVCLDWCYFIKYIYI